MIKAKSAKNGKNTKMGMQRYHWTMYPIVGSIEHKLSYHLYSQGS